MYRESASAPGSDRSRRRGHSARRLAGPAGTWRTAAGRAHRDGRGRGDASRRRFGDHDGSALRIEEICEVVRRRIGRAAGVSAVSVSGDSDLGPVDTDAARPRVVHGHGGAEAHRLCAELEELTGKPALLKMLREPCPQDMEAYAHGPGHRMWTTSHSLPSIYGMASPQWTTSHKIDLLCLQIFSRPRWIPAAFPGVASSLQPGHEGRLLVRDTGQAGHGRDDRGGPWAQDRAGPRGESRRGWQFPWSRLLAWAGLARPRRWRRAPPRYAGGGRGRTAPARVRR